MAEHTPGPWFVGTKPGVWAGPVVKADGGNKGVAFVVGPPAVDEANARLIASAPELLAALKRLLPLWEEAIGYEADYMDMANFARAAIETAEGRSE
jgi:hypothetical protein